MSKLNAAINFVASAINPSRTKVLGRQTAIEGLYAGFARYHGGSSFAALVTAREDEIALRQMFTRECGDDAQLHVIRRKDLSPVAALGALMTPDPALAAFAWERRGIGDQSYSLIGLTHTLSSAAVLDILAQYHLAPVQEWDALVCTSQAAKSTVARLLDHTASLYQERLGVFPTVRPQLPVIPLAVDCDAFDATPERLRRAVALRQRLGIATDDCAFLYFGRLSFHAKAHPLPMFDGLQKLAREIAPRRVSLLMCGQAHNDVIKRNFYSCAAEICPDVQIHFINGADEELSQTVWHAADVFVSLSDNIQETFGLTIPEAMAAGLPVIASDWNGYRDTVVEGETGFRIPTWAPGAGAGTDLARSYSMAATTYDRMIGCVAAATAVDGRLFLEAARTLVQNPERRRQMAAAGRLRARSLFDASIIVGLYGELCRELAQIRAHAAAPAVHSQIIPDPYAIFRDHPTHCLGDDDHLVVRDAQAVATTQHLLAGVAFDYAQESLLPRDQITKLIEWLSMMVVTTVGQTRCQFADWPEPVLLRTLGWFLKIGVAQVEAIDTAAGLDDKTVVKSLPSYQAGIAAYAGQKIEQAIAAFREAAAAFPSSWTYRRHMLVALKAASRWADAAAVVEALVADFPQAWSSYYERARVLVKQERFAEAEQDYRRVLQQFPAHAESWNELGIVLRRLKRDAEAFAAFQKATDIDPNLGIAHVNMGNLYLSNRKYTKAIDKYKIAASFETDRAGAYVNIGTTHRRMGDINGALRYLGKAAAMGADGASNNLAYLLLSMGKYSSGWPMYRNRASGSKQYKQEPIPPVSDVIGKHVDVLWDQGLGDEIFFLRFLPMLKEKGVSVSYYPQKKISSIIKRLEGVGQDVKDGQPRKSPDLRILIGDLPLLLGHKDDDPVPTSLRAQPLPERQAFVADILQRQANEPCVGVAWRGGTPDRDVALYKEVPLDMLAAALRHYPGKIVILQRNPYPGEVERFAQIVGRPVLDASRYNDDLETIFAFVEAMDDMVGVSNTNIHLRALCGRDADVLIPNPPDFRWMQTGTTSPWFPNMRVHREEYSGNWVPALMAWVEYAAARRGKYAQTRPVPPQDRLEAIRAQIRAGQLDAALGEAESLLEVYPGAPEALFVKGVTFLMKKMMNEARFCLECALLANPEYVEAMINLGVVWDAQEDYNVAVGFYLRALALRPEMAEVWTNVGLSQSRAKEYEAAISSHRRAIDLKPDYVDAYRNLALALKRVEKVAELVGVLQSLANLTPDDAAVWVELAMAAGDDGQLDLALQAYARARTLRPDDDTVRVVEAAVYVSCQRYHEAEGIYRDVLKRKPGSSMAKIGLVQAMLGQGVGGAEIDSLLADLGDLRLLPSESRRGLTMILRERGALARAAEVAQLMRTLNDPNWEEQLVETASRCVISRQPDLANSLWGLLPEHGPNVAKYKELRAIAHLTIGDFDEGWHWYRYRQAIGRSQDFLDRNALPADLTGVRIMLGREQGIGDELFFLRYAPELKRRGAYVGYVASPKMAPLIRRLALADTVAVSGRDLAGLEKRLTIGDLPLLLGLNGAECVVPSLRLEPLAEKRSEICERLRRAGPGPYYGVAWQAGIRARIALFKQVPMRPFAEMLRQLPGTVVCLQRQAPPDELRQFEDMLGRPMANLVDTENDLETALALMAELDELIGVSNTNVHLRAMVGRPCRVLVPFPPDFRWMAVEGGSPWFPESITYRKTPQNEWTELFDRMGSELQEIYLRDPQ